MHIHDGTLTRFNAPKTFDTRMAAEAWLHKERQLIAQGAWTPPAERAKAAARSSIRLRDFADDALAGRRLEPTTRSNYKRLWETRIEPGLGDFVVRDITADDLQEWWRNLGVEHEASRAHAWNLLKSLLKEAVEREIITSNPADNPRFKRYGKRPTRRQIILLTPTEISETAAKLPSYYAIALPIMAWCALRYAEVSELRVKDIDDGPDGMVIHVRRSAPLVDGVPVVKQGSKSDAGTRDVWVPPDLAAAIRQHLKNVEEQPNTLVVTNFRGDRLPRATFTKAFKAALPPAKSEMHVHALRHTGAVLAAQAGASTAELMDRLGHVSPGMAMAYQHIVSGRQRTISNDMSKLQW
ncbi:site-specific integrase [Gordonia sp. i37]|uniref:tyrosine-type recombinase/integrase n=1 Tax=Gordonia sp. i37 TaxID=1961707 RepID=UPI0009AD2D29|nr:site-specific integrase [Gordonia sp. i37]